MIDLSFFNFIRCITHFVNIVNNPGCTYFISSLANAYAFVEALRAIQAKNVPLHWESEDRQPFFFNPPVFQEEQESTGEGKDNHNGRKAANSDVLKRCIRRWNISVKVSGVSSRSSIFSSSNYQQEKSIVEQKSLICDASLPFSAQSGKDDTINVSHQIDNEGLVRSIGSVDCRILATNCPISLETTKEDKLPSRKDVRSWTRGISKGRNRRIWTDVRPNNNKLSMHFVSLLNGKRLDTSSSYKRPRDVKVVVRLDNKPFIHISSLDSFQTGQGIGTIPVVESEIQSLCSVESEIIEDSEEFSIDKPDKSFNRCALNSKSFGAFKNYNKFFTTLEERIHSQPYTPMKFGGSHILKHISPILNCLSLDDGFVRVVCKVPGKMQGSSINNLLNVAARKYLPNEEYCCTVCWTGAGKGSDAYNNGTSILECSICSLLIHPNCCKDKGVMLPTEVEQDKIWTCSACYERQMNDLQATSNSTNTLSFCISRKPRRASNLPSRFYDENRNRSNVLNHKIQSRLRTHKCTLCPHSGKKVFECLKFPYSLMI